MSLTYGEYLRLPELLRLQHPRSSPAEHDEMLFIVIHQVYELWFKLLLHEVDRCTAELRSGDLFGAISRVKRLRTVMKTLVGQLDILETMSPTSFLAFRDRLETASGFQSAQFRALEFVLGQKRAELMDYYRHDGELLEELRRRFESPTLVDAFYQFLAGRGVRVPPELLARDVRSAVTANEALTAELVTVYREVPDVAILLELLTDFDEGLQEWRYRHVKMVERTIGTKRGTGGSTGAEYLRTTLFRPVFPDLWEMRRLL